MELSLSYFFKKVLSPSIKFVVETLSNITHGTKQSKIDIITVLIGV